MVLGIGHAAYGVKDLQASLHFYVDQLGLEKAFALNRDDGSLWIVYLYAGHNSFVELFPEAQPAGSKPAGSYKGRPAVAGLGGLKCLHHPRVFPE
jgi:catechol 2,3-dioxygenase-like lactoylglutathione lyase family enzyme